MEHEKCATCKHRSEADGWVICANCIHNSSQKDRYEPLTNGDKIRAMTNEELVDVIGCQFGLDADICFMMKSCAVCILKWLRSPVEESAVVHAGLGYVRGL